MAALVVLSGAAVVAPPAAYAQSSTDRLYGRVMPEADRFGGRAGDPPVIEAFATNSAGVESLIGYLFYTSDLPPERRGYSGPIEALVGMDLEGRLTGVRVIDYYESHRQTRGDFLSTPGFQEQFRGKTLADAFSANRDVENISRATITVRAMARGVRDAARRVADAYLTLEAEVVDETADPATLTWLELARAGLIQQFTLADGSGNAEVSIVHVGDPAFGEHLLGPATYARAQASIERRGGGEHLFVYGVDGDRLRLFEREGWAVVHGGDTSALDVDDVYSLGLPNGGIVEGQVVLIGAMIVDSLVDVSRPLTILYDRPRRDVIAIDYRTTGAREAERLGPTTADGAPTTAVEGTVPPPTESEASAASGQEEATTAGAQTRVASDSTPEAIGTGAAPGAASAEVAQAAPGAVNVSGAPTDALLDSAAEGAASVSESGESVTSADIPFVSDEPQSLLEATLADTSWGRVGAMALVLALALAALLLKRESLRWATLTVTLFYLGFIDGGFLSITHVTSAIWVGPSAFVDDLPLLLIAAFTVVTTLVWGRVFCGFLCPFGALQDLIDKVVPARWQRSLPKGWHRKALKWKYVILAVILLPALAGSHLSLYPYFEPFGTVFFFSTSWLLWSIAGAFLLASAVVPRFYCRYACPLGAALAIGSLVTLRRIDRVEQCEHCTVCERSCPTGAIDREVIDFKECVRCNDCEVKLRARAGVCRHEMATVRSRLVQIERRGAGVADGA